MPSALVQNRVDVRTLQAPSSSIQPNPADAVCCITHLMVLIFRLTRLVLVFKNLRRKKEMNHCFSHFIFYFFPKVHDSSPSPVADCPYPSVPAFPLQEKERVLEEEKVGVYRPPQFLWKTQINNLPNMPKEISDKKSPDR